MQKVVKNETLEMIVDSGALWDIAEDKVLQKIVGRGKLLRIIGSG